MSIPTPHVAGEPVNGWNTGFDWNDPKNANEKSRLNAELNFLSLACKVSNDLVEVFDQLDTLLGMVEANDYVLRVNLPPFPLPGALSPVKLADVDLALPAVLKLQVLLQAETVLTAYVESVPTEITTKIIHVLRRLAKGSE